MISPVLLARLSLARFGFAVLWAATLALADPDPGAALVALAALYPLVDAAAVLLELRATDPASRSRVSAAANVAVSVVAAVALGWAGQDSLAAVLTVWGVWALVSGATQLATAWTRRAVGGQWPLVASGGLSVLVGGGFVRQGSQDPTSVASVAGYAVAGGVFFLVSALRLRQGPGVVGAEGIEPPTASL